MIEFFNSIKNFTVIVTLFALHAIFIENAIFTRALGSSTSLFIIRKKHNIFLFGIVLTAITTLSTVIVIITGNIFPQFTEKSYYIPLFLITVISFVYLFSLLAVKFLLKKNKTKFTSKIHLSAFNCAVLGALLIGLESNITSVEFIGFGLGMGIGFALATFLISVSHDYLYSENIPKAFRGYPITLLYIGILSLAFYGFIANELSI